MEFLDYSFNWIDAAIACVLVFCLLLGLLSGLVMQVASILSIVAGMTLSFFIGPLAAAALGRWIDNVTICGLLGHMGCFFTGSLIIRLLASFFSAFLKRFKLERFDRLAGGVLGLVKGLVIAAVLIVIAGKFQVDAVKEPIESSVVAPRIIAGADTVWSWAEEREIGRKLKEFKEGLVEKAGLLKKKGEKMAVEYGKDKLLEEQGRVLTEDTPSPGEAE